MARAPCNSVPRKEKSRPLSLDPFPFFCIRPNRPGKTAEPNGNRFLLRCAALRCFVSVSSRRGSSLRVCFFFFSSSKRREFFRVLSRPGVGRDVRFPSPFPATFDLVPRRGKSLETIGDRRESERGKRAMLVRRSGTIGSLGYATVHAWNVWSGWQFLRLERRQRRFVLPILPILSTRYGA